VNPAEQLNAIVDEIEARVANVLGFAKEQIFETRQTGEREGNAAYVSATVPQVVPHTVCAERATIEVLIGFHVMQDGRPNRVQRMDLTMGLRAALLNRSSPIPYAGLCKVTDFALSEPGDPDTEYITGGLNFTFDTILEKPE
jgi:hypothetical protein